MQRNKFKITTRKLVKLLISRTIILFIGFLLGFIVGISWLPMIKQDLDQKFDAIEKAIEESFIPPSNYFI